MTVLVCIFLAYLAVAAAVHRASLRGATHGSSGPAVDEPALPALEAD
jgi:hypothetical protein